MVVIGGSITCGGNTYTEDQRWINQVFQWINATWPHPEHKLTNACKPATPSMLFSFCMHQSVPDDTDLLFMEVSSRKHHTAYAMRVLSCNRLASGLPRSTLGSIRFVMRFFMVLHKVLASLAARAWKLAYFTCILGYERGH